VERAPEAMARRTDGAVPHRLGNVDAVSPDETHVGRAQPSQASQVSVNRHEVHMPQPAWSSNGRPYWRSPLT
jgi:hypothetical protein